MLFEGPVLTIINDLKLYFDNLVEPDNKVLIYICYSKFVLSVNCYYFWSISKFVKYFRVLQIFQ